jgi:hypothetical protein
MIRLVSRNSGSPMASAAIISVQVLASEIPTNPCSSPGQFRNDELARCIRCAKARRICKDLCAILTSQVRQLPCEVLELFVASGGHALRIAHQGSSAKCLESPKICGVRLD